MSQENLLRASVLRSQLIAEHVSLTFLLSTRYNLLFNRRLKIDHSLGDGLYCTDDGNTTGFTPEICQQITDKILEFLNDKDSKIELIYVPRDQLIERFTKFGLLDKVGILKTWLDDPIPCIKAGDIIDYRFEQASTDKERLKIFEIRPYDKGFLIRYPSLNDPNTIEPFHDQQVVHDMISEYSEWAKLINCDYVSKLNEAVYKRDIDDIKWIAEGLHEQKLAIIAEKLVSNFEHKRIVTIAGPSSSNKTTFAKRLAIALRVLGYQSTVIEMDDYFKDNKDVPFGPDGLQDFESINCLNLELLGRRVNKLLSGEKIPRRRFNFKLGVGVDSYPEDADKSESEGCEFLQLPEKSFLIIEGIHGLNPILLKALNRDRVTPIYVSALTPLKIDGDHRFPTSTLRLIRRMVRDFNFRGHSPRQTLLRWGSVRKGEEENILPYQHNAEFWFNSALVYEIPVLAIYAKGLLAEASVPEHGEDPNSEKSQDITTMAIRIQNLLNLFYPVSLETVPHISCIREFVGGSDLKY